MILKFANPSGQGRVRSRVRSQFAILFLLYGFIPFIPHGGHLRHKLEGPESATHPPWSQLWPWSAGIHWPHWRGSGHVLAYNPVNFSSENNHDVKILGWESKCDQNTASIRVLEAPNIITHYEFEWFLMMMYDVSEASSRYTFEARWLRFRFPKACQQPTWSPDMKQDCVKTIGNITTMKATTFSSNHWIPIARTKIPIVLAFPAPLPNLNLTTWPGGMREAA